jgi:hypothetical protein
MPVTPPIRNTERKPHANSSGVRNSTVPRHSVAIQLNILIPVGIPIRNDASMKNTSTTAGLGVVNMWCAQTISERNAITAVAAATAL